MINYLRNLFILMRYRKLLQKANESKATYLVDGKANVLDDCTELEAEGIFTLAQLFTVFSQNPKDFKSDLKKIETKYLD